MKLIRHLRRTVPAAVAVLAFAACDSPTNTLETGDPEFDLALFEQNIIENVTGRGDPVGWAYTISVDGNLARSGAFGDARAPQDGQVAFAVDKEINVASVTKFYTAIAVLQLLEEHGLSVNSSIRNWLPPRWTQGPGVSSLLFSQLLQHTSGLESTNTDFSNTLSYEGLVQVIETGVVNPKVRNYLNANFALFRILIPSLWSELPGGPSVDLNSDESTQFFYRLYMQQHVFDPIALPNVDVLPEPDGVETLYYSRSDRTSAGNGTEYGDWSRIAGGGGYYMSALEMAKVNAYWEHTEVLLSETARDRMKQLRAGMERESSLEERGEYYSKIGGITNGSGQGVMTVTTIFPVNGVDATVVINTGDHLLNDGNTFDGFESLRDALYIAFNEAWQ